MAEAESEKAVFWKTVVELRNKLESKTEETNRLEKQIENTKKHYENIAAEIVGLREENAKHLREAERNLHLQAEAKSSKSLADNLKKEVDEVRAKFEKSQELRSKLEDLDTIKLSAENAERKVQQLKKENESIAAEASRTRAEFEQKLKVQALDFQQRLASQESESDAVFKQRYAEMKDQMARMQKQLEETEALKEDVRGNLDGQIQALRKENSELRHQIEDLNDELTQKNSLLKREIERRNAAEHELAERLEGFLKENKKLRAELEGLKAEKEELASQTNTFQKRKQEMSLKEKEFSDTRDALSDLRKQNQQLQQRVMELEDELESVSKSRQSQQTEFDSTLTNLQTENSLLLSQNSEMRKDFEESQRNLQNIRHKAKQQHTEELNKTKMEQQSLDMENMVLKQKVTDLEFQIEKIFSERERLAEEFKNLFKHSVGQLENELSECNRLLRQYQAQNEEMQEVLAGNDTMSIKLHVQQMEEVEARLREEHHATMEENEQCKRVVGMYKITCRELRLRVGQSMAELIKH